MTRIVAGSVGGRRIKVPPKGTRPTAERVREALFSALESDDRVTGRVLDLYAGSGALGIEALSRGAHEAVFVESDGRAAGVLRANLVELGLTGSQVVRGKVETVLATSPAASFDLVLADPPYAIAEPQLGTVLQELTEGWLAEDAMLVLETSARATEPNWPHGLEPVRARRYGETTVHQAVFTGG
ncbi:16S rRNA (guanine(966)-N(2))-methyltransferase RsmD [Sciscionella sediminilitoris]|uniref:16S rRNA (guanine(966)-N(2))-methyltransferase RsmD n=1 Tax=Sciscionella sediminilitoris TaxID=1445613 RepID=UPI0004DF2F32|nr:16S rRNA (guanine(966)-N(2))-methyltransferase RsmD [Sciscionella sp. SE31]